MRLPIFAALCVAVVSSFPSALGQATTAQEIEQTFKELTKLSDDVRSAAQKINLLNAPLIGEKIPSGFFFITERFNKASAMLSGNGVRKLLQGPEPLNDADAQIVIAALTTFTQRHQALLNVVIGKHSLLTLIPFFEPIRVTLVNLEASIDTYAFYLTALTPTQKPAAGAQFGSLTVTIQTAIQTYSEPL